ncbi:MAG: hypothetical protein NTY19_17685 [Planctomycetota bacterium]|nr:hypothetical protein [Planctomycetota bacterium]
MSTLSTALISTEDAYTMLGSFARNVHKSVRREFRKLVAAAREELR